MENGEGSGRHDVATASLCHHSHNLKLPSPRSHAASVFPTCMAALESPHRMITGMVLAEVLMSAPLWATYPREQERWR